METCDLNDVMRAIGQLDGKVDGINQRLDVVNGRLGKHDDAITKIQLKDATEDGEKKGISWLGNVAYAVLALVAGLFGSWIQNGNHW